MDLNPKNITMDGHNLRLMEKPAKSQYCCNGCKEKGVQPCYKHENEGDSSYYLHTECYDSLRSKSYIHNLIGSNSNCEYVFHKEDLLHLGGKGVCEACGDDVKGWFFKCKLCKKPHYLHPSCAKLPIKKYVKSGEGNTILALQANSTLPSKCQICGSKETSGGLGGWNYISRNRRICYHWSCMKHMDLEKWNKDDGQNCSNKRSRETSLTSSQASKRMNTETETETVATRLPEKGKQKQDYDAAGKGIEGLPGLPTRAKKRPSKKAITETETETVATRLPEKGKQKQDYDAAGKGIAGLPGLPTRAKKRPSKKAILGFTAEATLELLNILFTVVGLPTLPLGLLLKLFK